MFQLVNRKSTIVILALLVLTSCAAVKNIAKDMARQEVLVKSAVARYLHEHPKHAAQVARIAGDALAIAAMDKAVTVFDLNAYVTGNLDVDKLLPEEREIVSALIGSVQKNIIQGSMADGVPDPGKQMIKAAEFLTWLQAVAKREARP